MTWDAATHSSRFAAPAMVTPLLSPPPSPKPEPANGSSGSDGGSARVVSPLFNMENPVDGCGQSVKDGSAVSVHVSQDMMPFAVPAASPAGCMHFPGCNVHLCLIMHA